MPSGTKYSDEFKQQIVDLHQNGKRIVDLSREYGISQTAIKNWIKQSKNTGSFRVDDNRSENEKELIKLRKENKQLQMENDILKQAALIFGRK